MFLAVLYILMGFDIMRAEHGNSPGKSHGFYGEGSGFLKGNWCFLDELKNPLELWIMSSARWLMPTSHVVYPWYIPIISRRPRFFFCTFPSVPSTVIRRATFYKWVTVLRPQEVAKKMKDAPWDGHIGDMAPKDAGIGHRWSSNIGKHI